MITVVKSLAYRWRCLGLKGQGALFSRPPLTAKKCVFVYTGNEINQFIAIVYLLRFQSDHIKRLPLFSMQLKAEKPRKEMPILIRLLI